MKPSSENKTKDVTTSDKRYTREYSKELIDFVNQQTMTEGENKVYQELVKVLVETNKISKPQDLMMLDVIVYDYMRIKRIQGLIKEEGDVTHFTFPNGNRITKANEASYLLNSVETQFRNMMKDMGLSRSERIKKKLTQEMQDFATFMSAETVDAEVVENSEKLAENSVENVKDGTG